MSRAFLEHTHFEELCMLASVGQISPPEFQELSDHMQGCDRCRESYTDFLRLTQEHLPLVASDEATTLEPSGIFKKLAAKHYKARFVDRARKRGIEIAPDRRRPAPMGILSPVLTYKICSAVAAVILVGMVGVMSHRWKQADARNGQLSSQVANLSERNASLQREVKNLSGGKDTLQSDLDETRQQSLTETAKVHDLQEQVSQESLAAESLGTQLNYSNAHATATEQKLRDAQQTLASLSQEITKLQAAHADDTASLVAHQVQVADLTRQAKESAEVIDKQQKLLAVDEDVRDLMAARNLHITDVFDVDGKGTRKSAFGRVFYTEGKSLIFYAFDLDGPRVTDAKHSFQAWGQITESKTSAVNLGIFYVDDPEQKRWILRFDNPDVLDKISAVFVTAEPHGGTARPSGQKLMFAYLGREPNHP